MSPARKLLRVLVPVGLAAVTLVAASAAQAEPSVADIQQKIDKSSAALEKVVEQYNKVNEELKTDKQKAAEIETKLVPLRAQHDEAEARVAELAADAYKSGGLNKANALLSGQSGEGLADRVSILGQISRSQQQELAAFAATKRQYEAQKSNLDGVIARQTALAANLTASKKKIQSDLDNLYALRKQAYGSATTKTTKYSGTIPAVSGKAGVAVTYAYNAIGTPYAWAEDGPDGYDCSGLTLAAWRAAGVSLPHNAAMQWDVVAHISRSQLQPGDLVFYNSLGHVAIYVGSNKIIEAPTFGESVKISSVDVSSPYGYGRVRA